MPELPEVENLRLSLQDFIGEKITSVEVNASKLRKDIPKKLASVLVGRQIKAIKRRAKYLIVVLDKGNLVVHLGMTGALLVRKRENKHDHIVLTTDKHTLVYNDIRKFGLVEYVEDLEKYFAGMGVEPLEDSFDAKYLAEKIKTKKTIIKKILMDNAIVVGIGNIYACEILFLSKIAPSREGESLNLGEIKKLVEVSKSILQLAIQSGGTTFRDYKHLDGSRGQFVSLLKVYGRAGKPCYECSATITTSKDGGRTTFFCPNCQKS